MYAHAGGVSFTTSVLFLPQHGRAVTLAAYTSLSNGMPIAFRRTATGPRLRLPKDQLEKQAQIMGCPLQRLAELGCRNGDQAASPLSGIEPKQHGPAILGDHMVDVRSRGGDRRPGRQSGHDARDLSINRWELVRHVACSGLGYV